MKLTGHFYGLKVLPLLTALCAVLTAAPALSQEKPFITERELGVDRGAGLMNCDFPEQMVRGNPSPEAVDPAGRWGERVQDLDMSLRFRKTTFTNGEPIIAYVYFRNSSSTNDFRYSILHMAGNHSAFADFDVSGPGGKPSALIRKLKSPFYRSFGEVVRPRAQNLYLIQLDQIFDFRLLGKYTVRARRELSDSGDPTHHRKFTLYSTRVEIEVIRAKQPTEVGRVGESSAIPD